MAFVNQPTAMVTIKMKDASGSTGSFRFHVPYATLASVALAAAATVATLVAVITGCSVIGFDLTYVSNDDAPAAPDAGSRVEDKGVFVWRTANARSTRFEIPGILNSVLNADGSIDITNTDIAALIAGVAAGGAIFAGADGSDITSLLESYQRFNRTTKRQMPAKR